MSGESGLMFIENSAIRLSCSDRTPMMKKLPRPTASSTIRIWLPGRRSCSTACRSANDFAFDSGAIASTNGINAEFGGDFIVEAGSMSRVLVYDPASPATPPPADAPAAPPANP